MQIVVRGNHIDVIDPGCVKTPVFNLRVEIPSRFRRFANQQHWQPLPEKDNRENNSAHSWLVDVFTQPGPNPDLRQSPQSKKQDLYCPPPKLLFSDTMFDD